MAISEEVLAAIRQDARRRTKGPWYDSRKGNPTFRRYFWALMLGLSIANIIREGYQLWRAEQELEARRT